MGALLVPAFAVIAVLMVLVAKGALAFNFALSGVPFTLSADSLTGDNFVQYASGDKVSTPSDATSVATLNGGLHHVEGEFGITPGAGESAAVVGNDGNVYVADTETQLSNADLKNLSQTICAPIGGIIGALSGQSILVNLAAGQATPAHADQLTVQAPALAANSATFSPNSPDKTGITIGEDLGSALGSSTNGIFSQAADHVSLSGLHQLAMGTEAGTFTLPGLALHASFVSSCG